MRKFIILFLAIFIAGSLLYVWHDRRSNSQLLSDVIQEDIPAVTAVAMDKHSATSRQTSGNGLSAQSSAEGFAATTQKTSGNEVTYRVSAKRPVGQLADPEYRAAQVRLKTVESKIAMAEATAKAKRNGWSPIDESGDIGQGQLMAIRNGKPLVYHVENINAGISTAADLVRDNPLYGVMGSNIVIGLWDAGSVRATHQEFRTNRVSVIDNVAMNYHSTHVCGTLIASGVYSYAKGMAPFGRVESRNWIYDLAEMTSRAMAAPSETNQLQLSNHSYGIIAGWHNSVSPVAWYGTWGLGRESDTFGNYSYSAASWDALCYDAPYFLPVKSAGNDRSDSAPSAGTTFQYYDQGTWKSKAYDPATDPLSDYSKGGYDTIPDVANAKNILTIGSVDDAVIGTNRALSQATMTSYSGWGPADDGRIKPDIVANGAAVTSTDSGADDDYRTLQGTSMASPNAAGSAALLVEYYKKLFDEPISSELLKGLIIHTADDLGSAGPDYKFGWGLMNTQAAAEYIRLHHKYPLSDIMYEPFLDTNNAVRNISIVRNDSEPIKVTICWTDPAGIEKHGLDNRTPVLVNDLDLRIIDPAGITNFPFTLSVTNPAALAVPGDNILDNMEQIIIPSPIAGDYTISVSHKGVLDGGLQYYALIIGGAASMPEIQHTPLINTTNLVDPYVIDATITSIDPLKVNGVWMFWSTNNFISVTASNLMNNISNDLFTASIPAQPLNTKISYYIYAETTNSLTATDPQNAPATVHSFIVAPLVSLDVWGSPNELGTVSPYYGRTIFPSGIVVNASASEFTQEGAGHRFASGGWLGANDVPASGLSNNVSFLIKHNSAIFWKWTSQYSLTQTSSVPDIVNTTNWWDEASSAVTITAQVEVVHNSISYHFAEWQLDGERRPDATNVAVNPVAGIFMETSRVATAIYLPSNEDSDNDSLPDWWERYYFGSLIYGANDDPDNDGYLNIEELEDKSNPHDSLSTPTAPKIVHTPLPAIISNPAPWQVMAEVTDNNAVADVLLKWRRNGLSWRQVSMVLNGTSNNYEANIPVPGIFGDSFEYIIQATDTAGYYAEDGPHNIFVAYPVIDISQPAPFNFFMLKNNITNGTFSIGNNGNTNLDFTITMEPVGLWENMENGTNEWTHNGLQDNWHISTNRYYSSSNSWYCGDVTKKMYNNGTDASLITPKILLADNSQLTFMQWILAEQDVAPYVWDGGVIEISTDNGTTYQTLIPEGGYPKLIVNNPDSPFAPDTPCFGGTGGWERVVVDLSAYAGKESLIRFRFGADLFVTEEGWYIDDVQITPLSITNDWLTLNTMQGNIPATGSPSTINLTVNNTNLPPRYSDAIMLILHANDPLIPESFIPVSLYIESIPQVEVSFAEQSSRNGEGVVTISNKVFDLDYDICSLEILYSLNNGQTFTNVIVENAFGETGTIAISNNAPPQIRGIVTTTNFVDGSTNTVTALWVTTNDVDSILLATNVLISCRAWDGKYWSYAVTSQPFMVDNEVPSTPATLTVTSHNIGNWSTNKTFNFNWAAANDGNGIGVTGYLFSVTNVYNTKPPATNFTSTLSAVDSTQYDGTNLWVTVATIDVFGNRSSAILQGPFMVDSIPPSAQSVTVQFVTSLFGNYIIGTNINCSWSGFADNLSGIASYYIATINNTPTTNDNWIIQPSSIVSNTVPNQTNTVYIWAIDNAGLISSFVAETILVLDKVSDYDGDGMNNGYEDIAGTDANDDNSIFKISSEVTVGSFSNNIVSWNSITNRFYTLFNATNLMENSWQIIPAVSNQPGNDSIMTYTNNIESGFYKVNVKEGDI